MVRRRTASCRSPCSGRGSRAEREYTRRIVDTAVELPNFLAAFRALAEHPNATQRLSYEDVLDVARDACSAADCSMVPNDVTSSLRAHARELRRRDPWFANVLRRVAVVLERETVRNRT